MKKIYNVEVVPGSEAEQMLVEELLPICKDKVNCRLAEIFGTPGNVYEIYESDYKRIQDHLRKGKSS